MWDLVGGACGAQVQVKAFGPIEDDASSQKAIAMMTGLGVRYASAVLLAADLYAARNKLLQELGPKKVVP
jgi:hypothetical protein